MGDTRRRPPLTKAVLRGLHVLAELGRHDLEGAEKEWLGPRGTFADTSQRDIGAALKWLTELRSIKGLGGDNGGTRA